MSLLLSLLGALFLQGQGTEVRHAEEFRFRVPDGYEAVTPLPDGIAYAWRKPLNPETEGALAVTIQILPGKLGRDAGNVERTRESLLKRHPGKVFEFHELKWEDFDLSAVEMPVEIPGVGPGLSLTVQVPTIPRAVQIRVVGPLSKKDQITGDLVSILQSVKGKTNWTTPGRRWLLFFQGGTLLLGWMIWAVYGLIWWISFKKHPERSPRPRAICLGTIAVLLMLGVGISLVSESFSSESLKLESPGIGGQVLVGFSAFSAAARASKLWNLKPAPPAVTPPPD